VTSFNGAVATVLGMLAKVAEKDLEAHESPRGSNRGGEIAKFFKADDYTPPGADEGYAWCAAAVDFWVQEFLRLPAARTLFGHITPPRTAAAFVLVTWGTQQGCLVFGPAKCAYGKLWPQRGDIVVYEFSHCGVIADVDADQRSFHAIEGNTDSEGSREGWEVARRRRTFNSVRAFIRLTPRAEKAA
jgi:hypothetical protein